jgi:hypothetical protein
LHELVLSLCYAAVSFRWPAIRSARQATGQNAKRPLQSGVFDASSRAATIGGPEAHRRTGRKGAIQDGYGCTSFGQQPGLGGRGSSGLLS